MTDYAGLLRRLNEFGVEFIIIGGVAAVAHGAARFTKDVDVVYRRSPENLRRLIDSLSDLHPYPRGAPTGLPFAWEVRTLEMGLNFTLVTDLGDIDLLGEIAGGGGYEQLLPHTETTVVFGRNYLCLGLEKLIAVKRAAGRPKDFEAIAELEALKEERDEGRA